MEFIFCFGWAISAFILVIVGVIGLFSAPTPILLSILVAGLVFTQKSIDKLNESPISIAEERDRDTIEKVEEVNQTTLISSNQTDVIKAMVYRGSNYRTTIHQKQSQNIKPVNNIDDQSNFSETKVTIQYRGVKSKADFQGKKIV